MASLATCLNGCFGTYATRFMANDRSKDTSWVGKYPYQSIASDFNTAAHPRHGGAVITMISIVSIPFDLVVDTILLPVDLILWPMGLKKDTTSLQ